MPEVIYRPPTNIVMERTYRVIVVKNKPKNLATYKKALNDYAKRNKCSYVVTRVEIEQVGWKPFDFYDDGIVRGILLPKPYEEVDFDYIMGERVNIIIQFCDMTAKEWAKSTYKTYFKKNKSMYMFCYHCNYTIHTVFDTAFKYCSKCGINRTFIPTERMINIGEIEIEL